MTLKIWSTTKRGNHGGFAIGSLPLPRRPAISETSVFRPANNPLRRVYMYTLDTHACILRIFLPGEAQRDLGQSQESRCAIVARASAWRAINDPLHF